MSIRKLSEMKFLNLVKTDYCESFCQVSFPLIKKESQGIEGEGLYSLGFLNLLLRVRVRGSESPNFIISFRKKLSAIACGFHA